MNAGSAHSSAELVDEISKWTVGAGLVTMVLFPLALPILALTVIAVLPLLLLPLAGALVAALVAVPVLLMRGLGRRVFRALRRSHEVHEGRGPARPVTDGLDISSHH